MRIYALDTRGLNRGSASSDILTSESPSQPGMSVMSTGDTDADAPNSLAVDTGGYVIRNENDFGKAFTEIDRDTSSLLHRRLQDDRGRPTGSSTS